MVDFYGSFLVFLAEAVSANMCFVAMFLAVFLYKPTKQPTIKCSIEILRSLRQPVASKISKMLGGRMLTDLDELVAECPDPRSRKYVSESVKCYKAGAYRSAVVSCWIAVAFDIVDKIRELSAIGDAMAQEVIARFDTARQNGDLRAALAFEKELLPLARDKFQFISHIEFIDLERLLADRNRCAHPSMVSDTEVFEASAELAPLHIVNATRYVLSQPAAQGKQALARLQTELDSNFFPAKREDILIFLKAGPLAKPRESLLKNFLAILLKRVTKPPVAISWEKTHQAVEALFAVSDLHPGPWKLHIKELLSTLMPTLQDDDALRKAADLVGWRQNAELWSYVDEAGRLRLRTFVKHFPSGSVGHLEFYLSNPKSPFYDDAKDRIDRASTEELFGTIWFDTPPAVIERAIALYKQCDSFASANAFAKDLRGFLKDSEDPEKHLSMLARAAKSNGQISGSNQFVPLVREFVRERFPDVDQARRMLNEENLAEAAEAL